MYVLNQHQSFRMTHILVVQINLYVSMTSNFLGHLVMSGWRELKHLLGFHVPQNDINTRPLKEAFSTICKREVEQDKGRSRYT